MHMIEDVYTKSAFEQTLFAVTRHPIHGKEKPELVRIGSLAESQALLNQLCCLVMAKTLYDMAQKGLSTQWSPVKFDQPEDVTFMQLFEAATSGGFSLLANQVARNIRIDYCPEKWLEFPGMRKTVRALRSLFNISYGKHPPVEIPGDALLAATVLKAQCGLNLLDKFAYTLPNRARFEEYLRVLTMASGFLRLAD